MNSLRRRFAVADCLACRSGVIAVREVLMILIILIVLIGLLCVVNQSLTLDSRAAAKAAVRPVYDISLDREERQMWVHRLREDVVRINLATGQVEQDLPVSGIEQSVVAHSVDGRTSLLCRHDGAMVLYREGQVVGMSDLSPQNGFQASVSDAGDVGVAATCAGMIRGWRIQQEEWEEFGFRVASNTVVLQIRLNSTGRRLAVATSDGRITFHSVATGLREEPILNVGPDIDALAWSHDERNLAIVTSGFQARVYDVGTDRVISQIDLDRSHPLSSGSVLKFSPDGRRLVATNMVCPEVYIWDFGSGTSVRRLRGHAGMIPTLQFSADGERLYTGSYDGTIREWSLQTCSLRRVVE